MNTPSNTSQENNDKKCHPFEYLRPQSDKILENWNMARAYVLDLLKKKLAGNILQCWHFEINGDSDLMLAIVRNLALYAHFINYQEYNSFGELTCKNRTIISIVSQKSAEEIETELKKEHNLRNLPEYCKFSVFGDTRNKDSYIDIEIEVVKNKANDKDIISISETNIQEFIAGHAEEEIFHIDTRMAFYTSKIYDFGGYIGTVPYEDINCADRYSKALDAFQYKILESGKKNDLVKDEEWKSSLSKAKTGLSNIFCADCFEIREKEIKHKAQQAIKDEKIKTEDEAWPMFVRELSCCEHSRWVVEKLILGYEPLSQEDLFKCGHYSKRQRDEYLKGLKNKEKTPKHIDICSNRDLRRIDPDNMKYDSFLMLAIPRILKHIREEDRCMMVEK